MRNTVTIQIDRYVDGKTVPTPGLHVRLEEGKEDGYKLLRLTDESRGGVWIGRSQEFKVEGISAVDVVSQIHNLDTDCDEIFEVPLLLGAVWRTVGDEGLEPLLPELSLMLAALQANADPMILSNSLFWPLTPGAALKASILGRADGLKVEDFRVSEECEFLLEGIPCQGYSRLNEIVEAMKTILKGDAK